LSSRIEFLAVSPYSNKADEFVRPTVRKPGVGERSGLTAHFFFGAKSGPDVGPNRIVIWVVFAGVGATKLEQMAAKQDEIRKAADRVAGSLGLDVVDVEFTGQAKNRTLCVYLEKNAEGRVRQAAAAAAQRAAIASNPEGAIEIDMALAVPERFTTGELNPEHLSWLTHEDCAAFSRDFGVLLDVEDLVPDSEYVLEASSPGLDRKLTRAADFERFKGSLVKIQTLEPIASNRQWQGRLTATTVDAVTLDLTATKQNSKARKTGVSSVEIALGNIEKAHLVPEF
jgi:ribosome maturation factor RimP